MSFLVSVFKPLAYISLPIFLIRSIAASSPAGRYYTRMAVYVGTLVTVGSCSVVIAAGMSLVGRSMDVNYVVACIFYAIAGRALDLKIEVEGEEHLSTRPAVLMANHQSMLDVLVIGRLMPKQTVVMAKRSLQFTPIGPFMSMSGAIFIDRGNNVKAIRSIENAGKRMKSTNTSLWMFPEGTRFLSKEPNMLPLKKGGFHLALNAGIPIIPIVTEHYWHLYRKGVFESGVIKVRVLPPISTTELTTADIGSLAAHVGDQMLNALRDISRKPDSKQPKHPHFHQAHSAPQDPPPDSVPTEPIISTTLSSSVTNIESEAIGIQPEVKGSSSSLASSLASSRQKVLYASETGTETEEDEGMILVGRPT